MFELIFLLIGTFFASLLTFFSGFGLGTLLLPMLTLFFPIELAILYSAAVHLLNNGIKLILFRKAVLLGQVLQFGIPAVIGSLLGASLLSIMAQWSADYVGLFLGFEVRFSPIHTVVGILLFFIGCNELFRIVEVNLKGKMALAIGGLISGFFGGIAGLQGAFRSYFLVKAADDKEAFLGTSAAVAFVVDLSRLVIYLGFLTTSVFMNWEGLGVVVAALAGIFAGKQLLAKVEMAVIHSLIAVLLIGFGFLLSIGRI